MSGERDLVSMSAKINPKVAFSREREREMERWFGCKE